MRYFEKFWWSIYVLFLIFVAVWTYSEVTYSVTEQCEESLKTVLVILMLLLGGVTLLIIYLKKWRMLIINGIVWGVTVGIYLMANNYATTYEADKFTHYIDKSAKIESNKVADTKPSRPSQKEDLIIYKNGDSGEYNYQYHYAPKFIGQIYLKAFEATKGGELSVETLKNETIVDVFTRSNQISILGQPENGFKIMEGEAPHSYVARFEVWFIPANGAKERKLFTKNYLIEGWQYSKE